MISTKNTIFHKDGQKHKPLLLKGTAVILLALVLAILSAMSYTRNAVWKNEIMIWKDSTVKSSNKARAHYNLGRLYKTDGRDNDALREYLDAARLDPADPVTHYNAANTYLMLGRPDEAIPQYHSAISLKSDYTDARFNLAVAVRMLKDREPVTRARFKPSSTVAHNNAGNVYFSKGNVDAALAEYGAALRLNPGFADAHYNLGCVYRSMGRDDDALREYQSALRYRQDDAMTHYNLGNLYYAIRRFAEAQKEYEAALKLKPDFGDARNNLQIVATVMKNGGD